MSQLYPIIGYADARAAVAWLGDAFGFEPHLVVDGDDGLIAHAELRLDGDVLVMIGSIQNDTLGLRTPQEAGGTTSGIYVPVDGLDSHYQRARAAGAKIVQELVDDGYGLRYAARDIEGHLWVFGTYRPAE